MTHEEMELASLPLVQKLLLHGSGETSAAVAGWLGHDTITPDGEEARAGSVVLAVTPDLDREWLTDFVVKYADYGVLVLKPETDTFTATLETTTGTTTWRGSFSSRRFTSITQNERGLGLLWTKEKALN